MEPVNLQINQKGTFFYNKWLKDTKSGIFIYAPVFLFFYLGLGVVVYGMNLKFILISIYPALLILLAFVRPYYTRKKYLNQMAKTISLLDNKIVIETYKWFNVTSIVESIPINKLSVGESVDIPLLGGKKTYVLKANSDHLNTIYIVGEFFDDINSVLIHLNNHKLTVRN